MAQMTVVTFDDVRALLDIFKPGTAQPSIALYTRYLELMSAAERPPASRNALGRALTGYGCTRHRNRGKSGGKRTEVHGWIIPGEPYQSEEDVRVKELIVRFGSGFHAVETVYEGYLAMAREDGWRNTLDKRGLSRTLTRLGRPKLTEKGVRCWFFS